MAFLSNVVFLHILCFNRNPNPNLVNLKAKKIECQKSHIRQKSHLSNVIYSTESFKNSNKNFITFRLLPLPRNTLQMTTWTQKLQEIGLRLSAEKTKVNLQGTSDPINTGGWYDKSLCGCGLVYILLQHMITDMRQLLLQTQYIVIKFSHSIGRRSETVSLYGILLQIAIIWPYQFMLNILLDRLSEPIIIDEKIYNMDTVRSAARGLAYSEQSFICKSSICLISIWYFCFWSMWIVVTTNNEVQIGDLNTFWKWYWSEVRTIWFCAHRNLIGLKQQGQS